MSTSEYQQKMDWSLDGIMDRPMWFGKLSNVLLIVALVWLLASSIGFGIVASGFRAEGVNMPNERVPEVGINASSGGSGVQQQQLDSANMGAGSNAERQRLASVPHKFSVGDPVRGPDADEYLRWCGVSGGDMSKYESKGYAAMNNPRGWLLNTMYDGEPSLKLVEGFTPDDTALQSNVGL